MTRLERRLRKLEARLTDCSGLVPHTKRWFDHWMARLEQLIDGERPDESIPIEFCDALIAVADRTDAISPSLGGALKN
jgi:hypothetical protein